MRVPYYLLAGSFMRGAARSMATCSVASEQSSVFASPVSPPCKASSSIRRSLAPQFTSTSEQAKPELPVCNKSSFANAWRSLGVDQSELYLALTLPTGQSFRWKLTGDAEYTGVVEKYLFTLRQTPTDVVYMLHSPCTCGAINLCNGWPNLCHDTHGPHLSTDASKTCQTKLLRSKTHRPSTCSVYAGQATSSKYGELVESGHTNVIQDTADARETIDVSQQMQACLVNSNSTKTGGTIYLCQTRGPQSCSACLDCAEVSLKNYLNLDTSLKEVWAPFVAADERFAAIAPHMRGARLLRQCPLECLFQFICSSNNHIQRISQMVDHLAGLGPYLGNVSGLSFHAFPTLETLAKVTEAELRKAGFGYRAKYIVGAVKELQQKNGGGKQWLNSLRASTLDDALDELCSLPGIGPKVASCIALFSLDQHHAIPVDTHVWQIATNYIMPELSGERLTAKLHAAVSEAFVKRFGKYAGWAQNVLFIAELASHQLYLPEHLRTSREKSLKSKSKKKQKLLES